MILFSIFACMESKPEETGTPTSTDSGEVTTAVILCADLSTDECSNHEECELVYGSPIVQNDAGEDCVDYDGQTPVGCADLGCSADPTTTVASPPDSDQCWFFASGCLLEGWETCSDYPADCQ